MSDAISAQRQRVRDLLAEERRRVRQCEADLLAHWHSISRAAAFADSRSSDSKATSRDDGADSKHDDDSSKESRALSDEARRREAELRRELHRVQRIADSRSEALEALGEHFERLVAEASVAGPSPDEKAEWEAERERLVETIDALERQLLDSWESAVNSNAGGGAAGWKTHDEAHADADATGSAFPEDEDRAAPETGCPDDCETAVADERVETLERELQAAMAEVFALKAENAELSRTLARVSTEADVRGAEAFDWETQKRRLLAELNGGPELPDPERLTIQGTIEITDEVIAKKDAEIEKRDKEIVRLKRRIDQLARGAVADSSSPAGSAGATNPLAPFSQEEKVEWAAQLESLQSERDALRRMQDEWREKLRQAEVEISLERARLAREQQRLDDKLHDASRAGSPAIDRTAESSADRGTSSGSKSNRGHWLSRLGLSREDDR